MCLANWLTMKSSALSRSSLLSVFQSMPLAQKYTPVM